MPASENGGMRCRFSALRLLTASTDGTARIWLVFSTVKALVEYARAIMPRALTPEQRKQFFLE